MPVSLTLIKLIHIHTSTNPPTKRTPSKSANTMFGWGENRERKENGEQGKPGRKFSLPSPQFSSSQIRRKRLERKVLS